MLTKLGAMVATALPPTHELHRLVSRMEEAQPRRVGAGEMAQALVGHLRGTRTLIVLDDVWDELQPQPFQRLAGGGVTLLMTTRRSHVVDNFGSLLMPLPLRPMEREAATHLLVLSSGEASPLAKQHIHTCYAFTHCR